MRAEDSARLMNAGFHARNDGKPWEPSHFLPDRAPQKHWRARLTEFQRAADSINNSRRRKRT